MHERLNDIEEAIRRLTEEREALINRSVSGLNIYLVIRTTVGGYDTYSDFVVAERTEEAARHRDPRGAVIGDDYEDEDGWWVTPKLAKATLIGHCSDPVKPGTVFCASFHAG
jgi:hypothetical protein